MMQFWIGQSQQYIAAQYAKSARSSCKQCKQKIAKDQVRLGLLTDDDHFAQTHWYHLNCFHFKPRHKQPFKDFNIQQLDQMVYGLDDLDPEDYDKVFEYLKEQLKNFKQNKYSKKKPRSKKAEKQQSEDEDESYEEAKSKKGNKKSKTQTKGQKQTDNKKVKKSSTKQKQQKKFITQDQIKKLQDYLQEYSKLSINELKQILQKNGQSKTGTKDELANKCADGKLFGRIPNCPKCGGGKPRFDKQKGTYRCPGYMEDTEFKNCNSVFQFQEIKRAEWVE